MKTGLAVMITGKCRGACTYCYATDVHRQHMSPETLNETVRHLSKHGPAKWVSIIGGEPLYDPNYLITCARKLRHVCDKLALTTSLPPTPKFKKVARELKRLRVRLTVSVDGPPRIHNLQRPTIDHESVMQKLDVLREIGHTPAMIRATLDPRINHGQLPLAEFIEGTMKVCARARVGAFSAVPNVSLVEPRDGMFDEMPKAIYIARTSPLPVWHQLWLVEQRATTRYRSPKPSCGAGSCMLAVDPTGALWPCHRMAGESVGDVFDGVDTEKLREWTNRVCQRRVECVNCSAWDICRGGCSAEDESEQVNETSCLWWRSLIAAGKSFVPKVRA